MLQLRMCGTVGLSIPDADTHQRGSIIDLPFMNVNVHRVKYTNLSIREWIKQKSQ